MGRRPVFAGSAILTAIIWFPFFTTVSTGNFVLVLLAFIAFMGVGSAANGAGASFFTEMFPAKVRYTGVAIGTQLGFMLAGFAPAIETAIQGEGTSGWLPVAVFAAVCGLVAAIAALSAKETHNVAVKDLDAS
ncbi:MFS transporter [Paenarthrobacter ureafaciens]|uniref:MFS transporter n=1 Tax=Paenarthrobacter ureafaciens TaxID=37931 RepID=UPI002DBAC081|nr:MFS transporter [Paenarthrobacter ureafaciens]MEC3853654.1 MFS transporter [Paenarthrobacter ureafaciens]